MLLLLVASYLLACFCDASACLLDLLLLLLACLLVDDDVVVVVVAWLVAKWEELWLLLDSIYRTIPR